MAGHRRRRRGGVRAAVMIVVVASACSGGGTSRGAAPTAPRPAAVVPSVQLSADVLPPDAPLGVEVGGLPPDGDAVLEVSSTDDAGRRWRAEAAIRADAEGAVELTLDAAAATGDEASALLSRLRPEDDGTDPYRWALDGAAFTVTVTSGGATASAEVVRPYVAPGVRQTLTDPEVDGFVGSLWSGPGDPAAPTPAVVLIGGSEGGYGGIYEGALLAAHGIPSLQLALFGLPGLPAELGSLPLETVVTALRWLGARPGVDPARIWIVGQSRGSEAAMLVGSLFPELVAGVVAAAPSSVALCAPSCAGPAWTLGGQPVPYTRQYNEPDPTDEPAAVIAVERIDGPVHTTCGGEDRIWDACAYADAIAQRRGADAGEDHAATRPEAGHDVAIIAPQVYLPGPDVASHRADEEVRAEAWAALLAALGVG